MDSPINRRDAVGLSIWFIWLLNGNMPYEVWFDYIIGSKDDRVLSDIW